MRETSPLPPSAPVEDELFSALALALAGGLSDLEKAERVSGAGSFREALATLAASEREAARGRAERERTLCRQSGVTIVTRVEPQYPELLDKIPDPPAALYLRGSLTPADALALAVVGSRRATPYGLHMAESLASELARRGLVVVSGLARGIDAAAHRAALEAGGRTLAVLGSGLDVIYPPEHSALAERIAHAGAVVSEQPLGTPPLGANFPRRNRVLSGLTLGTIVVEATGKSGSLITARHAVDQNRDVFAVPGAVGEPGSEGTHRLIQQGAKLVTCPEDVIAELRPDVQAALRPPAIRADEDSDPTGRESPLSEVERVVLRRIPLAGSVTPDRIAQATGLPASRVLAALSALELRGDARSYPGGSYGRTPKPRPC